MGIGGCRAGLQPDVWRVLDAGDGLSDRTGRFHAGKEDLGAVLFAVTAVHAAAGQIDHRIGAVDLPDPWPGGLAVPYDGTPGTDARPPAEDDHLVLVVKGAGEKGSQVS